MGNGAGSHGECSLSYALADRLRDQGLPTDRQYLFVIDGLKRCGLQSEIPPSVLAFHTDYFESINGHTSSGMLWKDAVSQPSCCFTRLASNGSRVVVLGGSPDAVQTHIVRVKLSGEPLQFLSCQF
jgi:hypothetical protein